MESHTIVLQAEEIGKDLIVTIYGGDEHHIGGLALAYPTQSHYRDAVTISVNTLTLPGHKDYIVASSAAESICKALQIPTVVTVGIHVDNASWDVIEAIMKVSSALVDDFIKKYQKRDST
ncbi:MAG: prenylated flavin chaperone LpdD [Candidatus Thorarchaeota archaeon]